MRCSCNGSCRVSPYTCPRGNFRRQYDPDYVQNIPRFTVTAKDISDTYNSQKVSFTSSVRVVKD